MTSRLEIPPAAIKATRASLRRSGWSVTDDDHPNSRGSTDRQICRALEAALPHLFSLFAERLIGDGHGPLSVVLARALAMEAGRPLEQWHEADQLRFGRSANDLLRLSLAELVPGREESTGAV